MRPRGCPPKPAVATRWCGGRTHKQIRWPGLVCGACRDLKGVASQRGADQEGSSIFFIFFQKRYWLLTPDVVIYNHREEVRPLRQGLWATTRSSSVAVRLIDFKARSVRSARSVKGCTPPAKSNKGSQAFCGIVGITGVKVSPIGSYRYPISERFVVLWFSCKVWRAKSSAYPFGGSVLAETTNGEDWIIERAVGSPTAPFFL